MLRCGRSGFAVDYWGRNPCVGAVFLTHAHADHLCGLSDAWEPDGRTVYCSAVTKALLFRKFPRLATRRDVRVETLAPNAAVTLRLPDRTASARPRRVVNENKTVAATLLPTATATDDDENDKNDEFLTVTALDAGHCPGSVAFLFEGACGRVFHTGDWRREDWCGKETSPFGYADDRGGRGTRTPPRETNDDDRSTNNRTDRVPRCLTRAPIDLLLLDNTYGNPSYVFPSRAAAAAVIAALVKKTLSADPRADVYVGVDSLGKEPLLAAIARAIGEPVRVTPERFQASVAALEAATQGADEAARGDGDRDRDGDGDGDPFLGAAPRGSLTCASTSTCRVFALPKQRVTREKLAAVARHTGRAIVGILPTGWAVNSGGDPYGNAAHAFPWGLGKKKGGGNDENENGSLPVVHAVPYSLHASFDELESLVRALRPRAIVGNTRAPVAPGAPSLDVAKHFERLRRGRDDCDDRSCRDDRVRGSAAFPSEVDRVDARDDRSATDVDEEGVRDGRAPRNRVSTASRSSLGVSRNENGQKSRALAPRGHFVSHAFNASDTIEPFNAPTRRLRLKPRVVKPADSQDARARDESDDAADDDAAVPVESPLKGPFKREETVPPNPPRAFAPTLASAAKTYVEAVSRLLRAFPKRKRSSAVTRDESHEKARESRLDATGALKKSAPRAAAEDAARKKRRHVPRWVVDNVVDTNAKVVVGRENSP